MLEHDEGKTTPELPADFTEFLSCRLGLEASTTLSMLGTFLVSFEPSGPRPDLVLSARPPLLPTYSIT